MKNLAINHRIKDARNQLNKTIAELSGLFEIPERTISNYERGVSSPSVEYINLLHTKFGISLDWLINGEGEIYSSKEKETTTIKIPEKGEVECSAGEGCFIYSEEITGYTSFEINLLRQLGANSRECDVLKIRGDSMNPTLSTGDKILVDRAKKDVLDGRLYILRVEDTLYIKRLQKLPKGKIRAISDNKDYEPFDLIPKENDFEICGRVLWSSRTFL
jgi:phage repressor protein C with HTH and peptisase S24 domain